MLHYYSLASTPLRRTCLHHHQQLGHTDSQATPDPAIHTRAGGWGRNRTGTWIPRPGFLMASSKPAAISDTQVGQYR